MRGATMPASPGGSRRPKASVYPLATITRDSARGVIGRPGITSSGTIRQITSASLAASTSAAVNPSDSAVFRVSSLRTQTATSTPESRRFSAHERPWFPYPTTATRCPSRDAMLASDSWRISVMSFAFLVWAAEEASGRGQCGGDAGGPLDHGGQVVVDERAVALERRGAEGSQDGGRVLGRNDRLGIVERWYLAPEVGGPGACVGTTTTPAAALTLLLLLAHTSSSVSRVSGRRPRAVRSCSASRSANELDLGRTRSAMWRLPATTSSTRSSTVPGQTRRWETTVRSWPMRQARSRAWSSTAGFHQRA